MSPKYVLHLSAKEYFKGKFIVLKIYSPDEFLSFSGINKSQKPDETGCSHSKIILRISSIWQANFASVILTLSFANLLPTPSAKVKNFSVLIQWKKKNQNLSHKRRIEWILYLSLDSLLSLYMISGFLGPPASAVIGASRHCFLSLLHLHIASMCFFKVSCHFKYDILTKSYLKSYQVICHIKV